MSYYVYILKSEKDGTYYKGFTEDYSRRLEEHNGGLSNYTSSKLPWILVYVEELASKKDALIRERNLKKATKERIEALITHPKNILKKFK